MQIFIYQLKLLLRNKPMLFWTFAFPLILATFFNLAFSKLNSADSFDPIDVAVVIQKEDQSFQSLLDELSKENKDQLLNIQYVSVSKAQEMLKDKVITGYMLVDEELELVVNDNGISQTIVQSVMDTYLQTKQSMKNIASFNPQVMGQLIQHNIQQDFFQSQRISSLDVTVVYFYTLIGMTCMYGGFWGLRVSTNQEANLSRQGTRVQVSPISKIRIMLTGVIAAFLCQYCAMIILFAYLYYGLNIAFGDHSLYIFILMAIGSLLGIIIGQLIGTLLKCKENTKISILTSVSLFCSFLSGMMIVDLKYLIQEYVPILSYMNPVSLITDALYALYYYPTYERFFFNIALLTVMVFILGITSILISRRKKYDSL